MQQCMKICPRMPEMSTEQGVTHEKSGIFTSLTYTKNTMGENLSQTSFGHISTNSLTILIVLMAMKSP